LKKVESAVLRAKYNDSERKDLQKLLDNPQEVDLDELLKSMLPASGSLRRESSSFGNSFKRLAEPLVSDAALIPHC